MRIIALIALIICTSSSFGGKLSKAFEALEIYNYFEAKRLFEKSLKKDGVPAGYGLSIIYARNDNPFFNLDSAYSKIYYSCQQFPQTKEKKREVYKKKFNIDSLTLIEQRDLVSRLMFERAREVNSEFGFQDFINKNPWSEDLDSAIFLRDRIAFERADNSGKSDDYAYFLAAYGESQFAPLAKEKMDRTLFLEKTYNNSFIDYVNFVKSHPDSPYRGEAEDKIFQIATKTGTSEAFRNFIIEFPSNRNIKQAWKYLYNNKLQEGYSSEKIKEFKDQYPDYPYQKELLAEYNMADKVLYPVRNKGKWGYCDRMGNPIISSKFEAAEWFQEGLAVIRKDDKWGYVNKLGELVIDAQFDDALPFSEGFALVEKEELWGIINRNGDFVIPAEYEDLGSFKNGLCYFLKDDLYGYFDSKGIQRLKPQYTEAFDFEQGLAVVSKNDYYGIIDQYGTTFIPFKYEDLYLFSADKYAALIGDYWGVINLRGDTIVKFDYDYIGKPVNGISIIEYDGEFNYVDTAGRFILDEWIETYPEYRQLAEFKKGYAKIRYPKGFNLIDSLGRKLFKTEMDDVGSYSDLIAVKKEDKWGYVNTKGQKVLPFEYTYAQSFNGNSAIIQLSPFYGVIDRKGNYLIDPLQEELFPINDSVLIAKSLGKYGLITIQGDTLLKYRYFNIEPIDEIVVKLEEGSEVFYYNCQTQKFIRRED